MSFFKVLPLRGCLLAMFALTSQAWAATNQDQPSLYDAVVHGQSLSQMRFRVETVDQQSKAKEANAMTLQTLLGWQTAEIADIRLTAQLINVSQFTQQFYDNALGKNQPSPYPTVPDPAITDINQLYLDYAGLANTQLRLGRQIIRLDNTRFIGDIAFRQVSQVFDGVTLTNQSVSHTSLMLGHYARLRQSTGKYRDTHLDIVHVTHQYLPKASVTGYGYLIDQADTGQQTGLSNNAHKDLGIRLNGQIDITPDWYWLHTAEYTQQSAIHAGAHALQAHYRRLGLGLGYHQWFVRLDQEVLSSHAGIYAFQTPLATAHPFQGWTDLFTTTPKQGMVDQFVSFGSNMGAWTAYTEWHHMQADHRFQTPTGLGNHYGNEWDWSLAYQWTPALQAKLEYAHFKEGDINLASRKADVTREWFTLTYQF